MTYTCFKYFHRFLPLLPRVYYGRTVFEWVAVLDNDCKYTIGIDQSDWNKLVGISNSMFPRKDSLRFVWRYNPKYNTFEIGGYVERDKEIESELFVEVFAGDLINMKIELLDGEVAHMSVNGAVYEVPFKYNSLLFRLNPYFGGNKVAPHTMSLKLDTI